MEKVFAILGVFWCGWLLYIFLRDLYKAMPEYSWWLRDHHKTWSVILLSALRWLF